MTAPASKCPRRVIKLGGSLLDLPRLADILRVWLAAQPPAENLLLVGGGRLCDVLGAYQAAHDLDDAAVHWLCVRAMGVNAALVSAIVPEAEPAGSIVALSRRLAAPGLTIVDPWRFLAEEEPRLALAPLPATWDVTSDSIAARLAVLTRADELVLLKSVGPTGESLAELARAKYVDAYFPRAAAGIARIRLVNLRAADFAETVVRPACESGVA